MPTRKNVRLKGYDYSTAGAYFVTICVKDGHEIFAHIVGDAHPGVPPHDPHGAPIELTATGEMVKQHIENISLCYEAVTIDKYTVMPNHVHMIVIIKNGTCSVLKGGTPRCASPTKSVLAKVINAFKSLTSKQFGESMWQRSYHDHIIRDEAEYQRIWAYIDENPAKWTEDCYNTKKSRPCEDDPTIKDEPI
ncbi:MAG: transposase [Oscillospiraceae bacterium]|nr:transposase [Oscillospiraceae bacterium]